MKIGYLNKIKLTEDQRRYFGSVALPGLMLDLGLLKIIKRDALTLQGPMLISFLTLRDKD